MRPQTIEVLAPAGSPEALTAAVRCGAAAVYLGVGAFNARQGARNFTAEELPEIVTYCHSHGTAVHLALNTLLREDELSAAVELALAACEAGVDALIIQDLGLARQLKAIMPAMPLHASTQLSCHTPAGVKLLRDAGFSRVVLSREMSREEIAACTDLGVELEVFVHGALCMSVSGQCYFSAMLGGRSGNRGQCAQTCRLPFAPTGEKPRPSAPEQAALSLRDQCLVEYVAELKAMGITSLKIEGRMKRPEYVAAATAVYTAAARREAIPPEMLDNLRRVFSRTGFTDGYYTRRLGGEMFGIRRKEDVTAAAGILGELKRTYNRENPRFALDMTFSATTRGISLTAKAAEETVTVTGPAAQPAEHRPLDEERAIQQLSKTGGTPFAVADIQVSLEPGTTLPAAQLNALRRDALEQLLARLGQTRPIPFDRNALPPVLATQPSATAPRRYVRLANHQQWSGNRQVELVILPLATSLDKLKAILATGQAVGVEIPRGMFGTEQAVAAALNKAAEAGVTAALCGNVGAIALSKAAGLIPIGGFGLNLFNREAVAFCRELGVGQATLSMELTFPQITALLPASLPVGLLIYGHQPLMLTRNCPRQAAQGSCEDCHSQGITDRTGTVFPVMCQGGCSEVLNSVPLYWGDKLREVPAVDFHLYHFTTETAQEVEAILTAYAQGSPPPPAITRGLYRRGVL